MTEQRILIIIEQMNIYLRDLRQRLPPSFEEYQDNVEKRMFCERSLQLLIECCIDICNILTRTLRLGIPDEEEHVFEKLASNNIISEKMATRLKGMKGFRNVLIHKYADIKNEQVFDNATNNLHDFVEFKKEILGFLKEQKREEAKEEKEGMNELFLRHVQ